MKKIKTNEETIAVICFSIITVIIYIIIIIAVTGCAVSQKQCPTYSFEQKMNIKVGSVQNGMTKCHVEKAWGKPIQINTKIINEDTLEEWAYGRSNVYMKNGFVCQVKYK